jgi:cell volume regulation protein A
VRDIIPFGVLVTLCAVALLGAVLSSRLSQLLRVPAPVIFLVVAAVAADLVPALRVPSITWAQRAVTLALVVILFDGGMHIGWRRFRRSAGPIVTLGVVGTLLTAAAVALLAHLVGFGWRPALLLGAAVSPTDPAVVFSVLGRREVGGRSGSVLEGESGVNDPVGIAAMVTLLTGGWEPGAGLAEFSLQMAVGGAVGLAGGWVLLWQMRRVTLPNEGLYPVRVLAGALALYGLATVAHGSGFLAVFVAGILLGDPNAPYKREIARFHTSLASLAEIVVFIVLGLTVSVASLAHGYAWAYGLLLAVALTFVIRPLLLGSLLLRMRLAVGERLFVLWAGLKGAVPILLGTYLLSAHVPDATRLYDIVVVVVVFSVVVQGGTVPVVARWCRVPMRVVEPEPWSLGLRFQEEPEGLRRFVVVPGAEAEGRPLGEVVLDDNVWVSIISRRGRLIRVGRDTVLQAGDEVTVLADPSCADPGAPFTRPAPG